VKYRVRNWGQFQHYKDRNPPWIKLHFSLLSSPDWVMLDDASRVLAIACMLIASRNEGEIDGSAAGLAYLKRVAYLNKNPSLKPLIECGFLEPASVALADASAAQADARPETEERQRRDRGEEETEAETEPLSAAPTAGESDPVAEVFGHWRTTHGHERAQLDPKRRKVIRSALASYSAADLCRCITGYLASPHHMGQNDRGTRYDDIELFLRDAKHIDAGLRFAAEPPRTDLSALTRRNVAAVENWMPPELRRAAQ
jgi:hypothetical protein